MHADLSPDRDLVRAAVGCISCRLVHLSILVMVMAGCTWSGRKVPLDAAAGLYETSALRYRVDAGRLNMPIAISRIEGQLVSYEAIASSPLPEESTGILLLDHPHPSGRTGFVRAQVVLQSNPPKETRWWNWNSPGKRSVLSLPRSEMREVWVLDLPKAEYDQQLAQLRADGFFDRPEKEGSATTLRIKLNNQEVSKRWESVPALEALMQRVRREGQLVSYDRPAAPRDPASQTSSVAAYRQLVAQGGTVGSAAAGPPAASGLAAPAAPAPVMARLPELPPVR